MRSIQRLLSFLFLITCVFFTSCESHQSIVTNVDERESNEIIVYLASKGIEAIKVQVPVSDVGTASASTMYNIMVEPEREVDAMAILNKVGLPRRMGTNLLDLFAKSGLMSSDREETIRYQAGLAGELQNTIRKIDGVIDADVQISFPSSDTSSAPGSSTPKITAAVYIKHQGILDDPNSHIETKIKRLMAGSVNGLSYDNVTVISDRSRFTDITLTPNGEMIGGHNLQQTYVNIWGLMLTKSSLLRFRLIFFSFIIFILLLCGAIGWVIYRFYPHIHKELLSKKNKNSSDSSGPPTT